MDKKIYFSINCTFKEDQASDQDTEQRSREVCFNDPNLLLSILFDIYNPQIRLCAYQGFIIYNGNPVLLVYFITKVSDI